MAPELYDSFDAGCPDGHVGYGRPPLSLSYAPPYQTVTQMYEYLYNSVYYANNRFTYWQDQSFNLFGVYNFEPHKRYREILSAWGKYLDNKPKKPFKTIAYLYKMSEKDDRFQLEKNICYNMCNRIKGKSVDRKPVKAKDDPQRAAGWCKAEAWLL